MRKKLKLALISNKYSRKTTFQRRKTGIMKKVEELSTLCGINACSIIYSPYDSNLEVWPSHSDAQRIISDFRTLPEVSQQKKMMDQETFLRERIAKLSEHLKRERKDNREAEMTQVMFQSLDGNMRKFHLNLMDLNDLGYLIEHYVKKLDRRIDILEQSGTKIGESSSAATGSVHSEGLTLLPGVVALAPVIHEVGSSSSSVAAPTFFNPIQHHHFHQQFCHPEAPQVGLYEQLRNMNHNQNQQQLFMETTTNPDQMSYAAEQMGFPFMDDNHHNGNHHHHHHNEPQQQHNTDDSSTAPAAVNSSSLIPFTSPDLTKNI